MKGFSYLLIFVFMMGGALGIEGVSPGSYEVDFEAGLEREFIFDFVLDEEEDLRVLGDLGKYMVLDKESVFGGKVVVSLKLPGELESYGVNNIWILAGDVAGIIKIDVPYPEKYVGLDLAIPDVNIGEGVPVNLKVSNLGSEGLMVGPVIEVYFSPRDDSGEPGDEVVFVFEGNESFLGASEVGEYVFSMDSTDYSSGNYLAVARVNSDGEVFEAEDSFRLGEFDIEISDYTHRVKGGGVERFEIGVESLYDSKMIEVYAEVRAADEESSFEGFDSSIVTLSGWESKTLVGYIYTKGLEGDVSLVIDVYYDGKVESKSVSVYVEKRSYFVFLVIGVLIFVGGIVFLLGNFLRNK
jgi:hypothetical protein